MEVLTAVELSSTASQMPRQKISPQKVEFFVA
jgi:hypothetical protein